jgi:acetyl/propionyl-CoA carboxylase alpha subunit
MEVGPNYDSLISKLCVWGADRTQALARLRRAIDEYQITGVKTTLPFHRDLIGHPAFIAGDLETRFLDRNDITREAPASHDEALLAGALLSHVRKAGGSGAAVKKGGGWRESARGGAVVRGGGATWRDTF